MLSMPVFILGLVMSWRPWSSRASRCFLTLLFAAVTLPVEFTPRRAIRMLNSSGLITQEENRACAGC